MPEGLSDAAHYRAMVRFDYAAVPEPFRFRVLVPSIAGGLARLLDHLPFGGWSREAFALLLVNAILTATAAVLLAEVARRLRAPAGAIVLTPFLYVSSFGVVNAHLAGLVDSAESTAVVGTVWLVASERWRWIPLALGLAALGKETAPMFACVYVASALLWGRLRERRTAPGAWSALALGGATAVLAGWGVRHWVGPGPSPGDALSLGSLGEGLLELVAAKSQLYTFGVLGMAALPELRRMPGAWLAGSAGMALVTVALAAFARLGENASRPLFDVLAPLLCVAGAKWLGQTYAEPAPPTSTSPPTP